MFCVLHCISLPGIPKFCIITSMTRSSGHPAGDVGVVGAVSPLRLSPWPEQWTVNTWDHYRWHCVACYKGGLNKVTSHYNHDTTITDKIAFNKEVRSPWSELDNNSSNCRECKEKHQKMTFPLRQKCAAAFPRITLSDVMGFLCSSGYFIMLTLYNLNSLSCNLKCPGWCFQLASSIKSYSILLAIIIFLNPYFIMFYKYL